MIRQYSSCLGPFSLKEKYNKDKDILVLTLFAFKDIRQIIPENINQYQM